VGVGSMVPSGLPGAVVARRSWRINCKRGRHRCLGLTAAVTGIGTTVSTVAEMAPGNGRLLRLQLFEVPVHLYRQRSTGAPSAYFLNPQETTIR